MNVDRSDWRFVGLVAAATLIVASVLKIVFVDELVATWWDVGFWTLFWGAFATGQIWGINRRARRRSVRSKSRQ